MALVRWRAISPSAPATPPAAYAAGGTLGMFAAAATRHCTAFSFGKLCGNLREVNKPWEVSSHAENRRNESDARAFRDLGF
eukprot:1180982-Prorocentrum_minimum.AAC.2